MSENINEDDHLFDDENLSEEEKLKLDNDLMRLKIELNGGKIIGDDLNDLPPEIESIFLKNIIAFEEKIKNYEEITVAEKLGFPEFIPTDELNDEGIESETNQVLELLLKHGIAFSNRYPVDPRVFYDFMIQDFMKHKVLNVNIEGMINYILYEELVPNPKGEVQAFVFEFVDGLDQSDLDQTLNAFDESARELNRSFWELFFSLYSSIKRHEIRVDYTELINDNKVAKVSAFVTLNCTLEDSNESMQIFGDWHFELKYHDDQKEWKIQSINLPFQKPTC